MKRMPKYTLTLMSSYADCNVLLARLAFFEWNFVPMRNGNIHSWLICGWNDRISSIRAMVESNVAEMFIPYPIHTSSSDFPQIESVAETRNTAVLCKKSLIFGRVELEWFACLICLEIEFFLAIIGLVVFSCSSIWCGRYFNYYNFIPTKTWNHVLEWTPKDSIVKMKPFSSFIAPITCFSINI